MTNPVIKISYNKKIWYYMGLIGIIAGGVVVITTARKPIVIILMAGVMGLYILLPLLMCVYIFNSVF